ncbi:MAG: hypothetical protein AB9869_23930 [Verrucomicrobiia bacterium]
MRIVAIQKSTTGAMATLSNNDVVPVELTLNELSVGEYTLVRKPGTSEYHGAGGGFKWVNPWEDPAKRIGTKYEWGDTVTVFVQASAEDRINALPPHIADFFTTTKSEAQKASKEDLEQIALAGTILEKHGITPDELSVRELARAERENSGIPSQETSDPVGWAQNFVLEREAEVQRALNNRNALLNAVAQFEQIPDEKKGTIKSLVFAFRKRDSDNSWEHIETVLRHSGISLRSAIEAFELELRSITNTFLSQAQLALFRIEKTYLADANVGVEEERLKAVVEKIRPGVRTLDEATQESDRRKSKATLQGLFPLGATLDPEVPKAEALVKSREEELEQQASEAGLPVVNWHGFDLDTIRGGNIAKTRSALRQFVYGTRSRLRAAFDKMQDITSLYQADRMVTATKEAVGIKNDSILGQIIAYRSELQTSDRSFWSTLWDVITIALMFVPGNIGIALRLGAGMIGTIKEADKYAKGDLLHKTRLASESPSPLGVLLAVGGTFLDLPKAGRGAISVLEGEANASTRLLPTRQQPALGKTDDLPAALGPSSTPILGGGQTTARREGHLASVDLEGNLHRPNSGKLPPNSTPTELPNQAARTTAANDNISLAGEVQAQQQLETVPLAATGTDDMVATVTRRKGVASQPEPAGRLSMAGEKGKATKPAAGSVRVEDQAIHQPRVNQPPAKTHQSGGKEYRYSEQSRANLVELDRKFPNLEDAHITIRKRGSGPGMRDETMFTNGLDESYEAKLRSGEGVQLDDITPDGVVVEVKMRTDVDLLRQRKIDEYLESHGRRELDFETNRHLRENVAADAERAADRYIDMVQTKDLEGFESQLVRQHRFIEENGLPGGQWITDSATAAEAIKSIISRLGLHKIKVTMIR